MIKKVLFSVLATIMALGMMPFISTTVAAVTGSDQPLSFMDKYSPGDEIYELEMPSGDRVEIGNRKSADFETHIRLNRWGGECFIEVGLPATEKATPFVEDGKLKWVGQKLEAHFYELDSRIVTAKGGGGKGGDMKSTQNELGGFEFEIILKEKPATNQIVFDIQAQGLRFSYQPPLTQEEIDAGAIRPDNVVGSYAVYHTTKRDNEYETGKAFHIYRPLAVDALGDKIWCELDINKYINPTSLTVTIPQKFLDEATYPVSIDPDFGYTTIGGSEVNIADGGGGQQYRRGSTWTMPAGGGMANYIRARVRGNGDDCDVKAWINQKDSGGAGTHGQIATDENLDCISDEHWEEFTLSSEELTESVDYILSILAQAADLGFPYDYFLKYDTNGAVDSYYESNSYSTPESPWVVDAEGTTLDCSIYCNYAPVVAPTVTTQAATNVEETTATGNGNITDTGGENCDYRGIAWDTSSHGDPGGSSPAASDYPNYNSEGPGSYGTGAFTRSMTSLAPGATHYCRAYAHNSEGWNWGSEVTFYTKPNPPTGLGDTGRTYNSISLSWTKGTGAEKTMVRYRTDQYPTGTGDGTQGYFDTGSATTVGTLSAGQIYYFRAWCWDTNSGYSDDTSDDTAYTLPGDPSNLSATTVSDTQIDLTWIKGTGGDKTMVRRKEGSYPANEADGDQVYFDTGVSKSDTGRTPATLYYYRIWAYDSDSTYYSSGYSSDSATTYGPPSMTTNAASSVEETSATMNGEITAVNGDNAITRGFEWDTDTGAPYANDWHEDGDFGVEAFDHALNSLTKGELYYYRAYAINTYGTGYGSEVTFLTKPDQPNTFVATAVSGTQIDFTWVKGTGAQKTYIRGKDGSYPANRADGYEVYFDTGTTDSDTGLTGGHTYYYKAWGYATEGGKDHYSDLYDSAYASPGLSVELWFQPNTMVTGTALPDRAETAQNGTITWGTNPAGVTAVLGSMVSREQPTPGITGDEPAQDVLPHVEVTDWYIDPDVGGALLTNPVRPFVTLLSDNSTLTEIQSWRLLGIALILMVTVATARSVGRHQGITMIAAGCGFGLMVALTVFPMWALVFAIGMFIGGLVMERAPSL